MTTPIHVLGFAGSLTTGEANRDAHLRSADFLDVEQYPTLTFTSTRVEPANGDRLRHQRPARISTYYP